MSIPNGEHCMVNQALYHLGSRGIEFDLLPMMEEKQIPVMAYCPLAQAGTLKREMLHNRVLNEVAQKYGISVMQLLLLFVLQQPNVIAIPRSGKKEHVLLDAAVRDITFSEEDYRRIGREYPAPTEKTPLDEV